MGIMQTYIGQLLPMILTVMKKIQIEEDDDDDEWGVPNSCACLLNVIAKLMGDAILASILEEVSGGITSTKWLDKYSALMIFGSVLSGPTPQYAAQTITPAMGTLLTAFKDQSHKVRETTAWMFSKLVQDQFELVANAPEVFNQLIHNAYD